MSRGYCQATDIDGDNATVYYYFSLNGEIDFNLSEDHKSIEPDILYHVKTWTDDSSVGDTFSFHCLALSPEEAPPNEYGFGYSSSRWKSVTTTIKNPYEGGGSGSSDSDTSDDEQEETDEDEIDVDGESPPKIIESEIDLTAGKEESDSDNQQITLTAESFKKLSFEFFFFAVVVIILIVGPDYDDKKQCETGILKPA